MEQATRLGSPRLTDYLERFWREGALWASILLAIFLVLALASYSPGDPGWSFAGEGGTVNNAGGRIGAWFADVSLFLVGLFAYLIPVALAWSAYLLFREHEPSAETKLLRLALRWTGLILTLFAGAGLISLQFAGTFGNLPNGIGGGLGQLVSALAVNALGFGGAALLLLALLLTGLSLFTGISPMLAVEGIGDLTLMLVRLPLDLIKQYRQAPAVDGTLDDDQDDDALNDLLYPAEDEREDAFADGYEDALDAFAEPEREPVDADDQAHWEPSWLQHGNARRSRASNPVEEPPAQDRPQETPKQGRIDRGTRADLRSDAPSGSRSGAWSGAGVWSGSVHGYRLGTGPDTEPDVSADTETDAGTDAGTYIGTNASVETTTPDARLEPAHRQPVEALRLPADHCNPGTRAQTRQAAPRSERPPEIEHAPAQEPWALPTTPAPAVTTEADWSSFHRPAPSEDHALDVEDLADDALVDNLDRGAYDQREHHDSSPATTHPHSMSGLGRIAAEYDPPVATANQAPAQAFAPTVAPSSEQAQPQQQAQVPPTMPPPPPTEPVWAAGAAPGSRQSAPTAAPPSPPVPERQRKHHERPPLDLLDPPRRSGNAVTEDQLESMSRELEARLAEFGVVAEVVAVHPGPVVALFELELAPGVKVSKITGLSKDIARALSKISVRVVEVIPGKSVIGLEVPNNQREMVTLSEILSARVYQEAKSPLTIGMGTNISGEPVVADLARMPHALIAGTTGSGKSVAINAMILSLLYKAPPEEVRLIMIDPKMLELSVYEGIPHLLTPVVTDMKEAANALRWCVGEMERRYKLMAALGVRNIAGFNRQVQDAISAGQPMRDPTYDSIVNAAIAEGQEPPDVPTLEKLPNIVVIIDELADMMMVVGKKVEELIARLAQKARASGIHLLLATQRPSVDVLTGLIKANIPTRMAFKVSAKVDSRTVLDQMGAEHLLGHGDMLYLPPGGSISQRVHGAFVDDPEVHRVVDFLKQQGEPDYIENILQEPSEHLPGIDPEPKGGGDVEDQDALFDEAVQFVVESRRASISGVQRKLKIGYNRAARMIEEMERIGVVGAAESNGNREVLSPPPPRD